MSAARGVGPSEFAAFFEAIHGHAPYPWQRALARAVAESDTWPGGEIAVPSGAGKTAALDVATFHLALRAKTPARAAIRIVLASDRRPGVDHADAHARRIARALNRALTGEGPAGPDDVLARAALALKGLAGAHGPPLVAARLRGGAPLEHEWARSPVQPTLLCSTIDQVGSRLLLRGYGVSERMRPIHAGLLGTHTLVLIDPAERAGALRETLEALEALGGVKTKVVTLTAGAGAAGAHGLSAADRADPRIGARLGAVKRTRLVATFAGDEAAFVGALASRARAMRAALEGEGVCPAAVGVAVNRVERARAVWEALGDDAVLVTGRTRATDADALSATLARWTTGARGRAEGESAYIVTTQCLEGGTDLDLDGLVTEAAPLDALRQRFGRVHRDGRAGDAPVAVLARKEDVAARADDTAYGARTRATWKALERCATRRVLDVGADALDTALGAAQIDPATLESAPASAPTLMPAHIDAWSRTAPRPKADPQIAPFLHGRERASAPVAIVWRGDLTRKDLETGRAGAIIALMPPRAREALEVPLWAAAGWLARDAETSTGVADVAERAPKGARAPRRGRPALRWAGPAHPDTATLAPGDLEPGDLIVVPAAYGGCDRFGWAPAQRAPVADAADAAATGARRAVRIARDVARSPRQWRQLRGVIAGAESTGRKTARKLLETLERSEPGDGVRDVRGPLEALLKAKGPIEVHRPYAGGAGGGAVLIARGPAGHGGAGPSTEDEHASHTSTGAVSIDAHGTRVAHIARGWMRALGLETTEDDVALAARLHDAGKADPRVQAALAGASPWNRPPGGACAKGPHPWTPHTAAKAGLPARWRHEALSVRMARAHPALRKARDADLVLWLIGTHHGLGRPMFAFDDTAPETPEACLDVEHWTLDGPGPESPAFDTGGADWPALYERLKARYGVWGLAHLEAIVRLADHRASEEECGR